MTTTTSVNLNKVTAIEICDAVKIYMKSRIAEYYIIAPAIMRTIDSYNSSTGRWIEPPRLNGKMPYTLFSAAGYCCKNFIRIQP